jgi:AcrR family transcriptional regulator
MKTAHKPRLFHRELRSDAQRNRERLLIEARTLFAERGADASLEEVARRAGVGVGTLYRHFPTREALLEAVLADDIKALRSVAEGLCTSPSAREGLGAWLRALLAEATKYRNMSEPLMKTLKNELSDECQEMLAAGERLLVGAQKAGEVRADASIDDLIHAVAGVAWASEQDSSDPAVADRLLALMIDGLRPQPPGAPAPRPTGVR